MNKATQLVLATALSAGLSSVGTLAFAADLATPMHATPMVAATTSSWDGLYLGAHAGYAWGTFALGAQSISPAGWIAGGQIGYNFRLADQLIAGIEGDIGWSNEAATNLGQTATITWEGSVRGRLGLDLGQFMPYAEAGVAFANATNSPTLPSPGVSNASYTGWTVGAGVETMLADHLSTNLEVRYTNYGSQIFGGPTQSVSLTDTSVRIGLNYHP